MQYKWKATDRQKNEALRWQMIWLAGLALIWEAASRLHLVNPLILPAASDVFLRMLQGIREGTLALQLLQSIALVLAGLAVGSLIGFLMACLEYFMPFSRPLLSLLTAMLHPLPGIAILPIVLAIAGLGLKSVYLVILHSVIWSFFLSMKTGFHSVDSDVIDAALVMGAGKWQLVRHILLPVSQFQVMTGFRIGWSRGWRALISAEMVFSAIGRLGGIGWYLFERRSFMDITGLYAGICLVIITGVLMENVLFRKWSSDQD